MGYDHGVVNRSRGGGGVINNGKGGTHVINNGGSWFF